MARPAASADVHPSGRRSLEARFHVAPEPASQRWRTEFHRVAHVS